MERAVFDRMAEHDQVHWWYVARRRILADLIAREVGPARRRPHPRDRLRHRPQFRDAAPLRPARRARGRRRGARARQRAARPCGRRRAAARAAGVPDGAYDLIALLDVLEHVDGDRESLESIAAKLAPGGRILVTVPAYQWMWSAHDVAHHHKRRYSKQGLRRDAEAAGLKVEQDRLFQQPALPARRRGPHRRQDRRQDVERRQAAARRRSIRLFQKIFGLERHLVGRVPFPAGVSLFALLSTR